MKQLAVGLRLAVAIALAMFAATAASGPLGAASAGYEASCVPQAGGPDICGIQCAPLGCDCSNNGDCD